jgi:8-oxo-dGTP pyrophosphatase MutT (NUDIX family)
MITEFKTFLSENSQYSEDQYFWGNIGGGVLPICTTTNRILLPLRSDEVLEGGTWGVWGGKIDEEDDETESDIEDVVKREFEEESRYNGHIELIPSYVFKTSNNRFTYYNFIGLIDHEYVPQMNWETQDFRWVTLDELLEIEPKHYGLVELLKNDLETIKKYCNY